VKLPQRRKAAKMGTRRETVVRSLGHLAWVRGHECAVPTCRFRGRSQAAHVRVGTDGSLSKKPGDNWVIPLCNLHHASQHSLGEAEFERLYELDMKRIAEALWQKSPHRVKWEKRTEARNYTEEGE